MTKYASYSKQFGNIFSGIIERDEQPQDTDYRGYTTILPPEGFQRFTEIRQGVSQQWAFIENNWIKTYYINAIDIEGEFVLFGLRNSMPVLYRNPREGYTHTFNDYDFNSLSPFPTHDRHQINALSHTTQFIANAMYAFVHRRQGKNRQMASLFRDFHYRTSEAHQRHGDDTTIQKRRIMTILSNYRKEHPEEGVLIDHLIHKLEVPEHEGDYGNNHKDSNEKFENETFNFFDRVGGTQMVGVYDDITTTAIMLRNEADMRSATHAHSQMEAKVMSELPENQPAITRNARTGRIAFPAIDFTFALMACKRVATNHTQMITDPTTMETAPYFPISFEDIPEEIIDEINHEYNLILTEPSGTADTNLLTVPGVKAS